MNRIVSIALSALLITASTAFAADVPAPATTKPSELKKPTCGETLVECKTNWDKAQAQIADLSKKLTIFTLGYNFARQQRDEYKQKIDDLTIQSSVDQQLVTPPVLPEAPAEKK